MHLGHLEDSVNLVPRFFVHAFRKLRGEIMRTRQHHRDATRPIPDALIEKYYRAIWALDTLGPPASEDRWNLRAMWRDATLSVAQASGPDGGAIAEDIVRILNEQCERILREVEKDPNRAEWEKQRDFLVGSLRRIKRATALNDVDHLHFYKKNDQTFSVDLHHPVFQVGYWLWQGCVEELKAAVTFTVFRERPPHLRVDHLLTAIRRIIRGLEHYDMSGFPNYQKSSLHLSKEQEGRVLWEALREEIARVIAQGEARAA